MLQPTRTTPVASGLAGEGSKMLHAAMAKTIANVETICSVARRLILFPFRLMADLSRIPSTVTNSLAHASSKRFISW
jgi:hypothetical protein